MRIDQLIGYVFYVIGTVQLIEGIVYSIGLAMMHVNVDIINIYSFFMDDFLEISCYFAFALLVSIIPTICLAVLLPNNYIIAKDKMDNAIDTPWIDEKEQYIIEAKELVNEQFYPKIDYILDNLEDSNMSAYIEDLRYSFKVIGITINSKRWMTYIPMLTVVGLYIIYVLSRIRITFY